MCPFNLVYCHSHLPPDVIPIDVWFKFVEYEGLPVSLDAGECTRNRNGMGRWPGVIEPKVRMRQGVQDTP